MAITEANPEEMLTSQEAVGFRLATAREQLSTVVQQDSHLSIERYEGLTCEYLNALQTYWFEGGAKTRYSIVNEAPAKVKSEAELVLGHSVESTEDVALRMKHYQNDDVSRQLLERNMSHVPRSVTLTLLDLIDQNLSKKKLSR